MGLFTADCTGRGLVGRVLRIGGLAAAARVCALALSLAAAAVGGVVPAAASPAPARGVPAGGWAVTLRAQAPTVSNGSPDTLTAQANADVSGTGLQIEIYDHRTGRLARACGSGTTCTVTKALTAATRSYIAYIAVPSATVPPASVQASSAIIFVTWSAASVTIRLSAFPDGPGSSTWTIETEASNSAPSGYHVGIFDETTGKPLAVSSGQTPYVAVTLSPGGPVPAGDSLVAFVASYNTQQQPVTIIASSNTVPAPI